MQIFLLPTIKSMPFIVTVRPGKENAEYEEQDKVPDSVLIHLIFYAYNRFGKF
jgi:hypothetical protein